MSTPVPSDDALFSTIGRFHGDKPWGAVLDAGTGWHSLSWIRTLQTTRWTAITGARAREESLLRRLGTPGPRQQDRIVTGNWTDPILLHDDLYDVVIADYLLGALDGFAPYYQVQLFERLRRHVRPESGRIYVVGLEPYPDQAADEGGRLVLEIARLRDACILLAGHRCYREYPREWVHAALERAGFGVEDSVAIPIVYRRRFVDGQLDVCVRKLAFIRDPGLKAAMRDHIADLRARAHAHLLHAGGGISFGSDYVVAAGRRDG